MKYTWLLFDADGTLWDYETAERKALAATFASAGLPYDGETLDLYRRINAAAWEAFERGEMAQPELHLWRFEQLMAELGQQTDIASFGDRYLYNLGHTSDHIAGAEEVVARLAQNYRLFLITNGIPLVQRTRLSLSPIRDYLQGVVISGEIGHAKPDRRIFDAAFAGMGNPPKNEVLIIGDSLSADIQGGISYGIDTCWYNPEGRTAVADLPVVYEIESLYELLEL